jgi:signal transduction histidine kinase
VPESLQSRIFEPFYRLPGASEREGGVGLGLSLVRSIALRHAGSVRCSNQPQGGACFELRLPRSGQIAP